MLLDNVPLSLAILVFSLVFLYWLLPSQFRKFLVLSTSFGLLAYGSPFYLLFLVVQVGVTYSAALVFRKASSPRSKFAFVFILVWHIACLFAFKLVVGANWENQTLSTIGISYISFRLVNFAVSAYRNEISVGKFSDALDLLNYLLFFPSLIAGPILKYELWILQEREGFLFNLRLINLGLFRILIGIAKKFVIADYLALHLVRPIFSNPDHFSNLSIGGGVWANFIRIYLDFSGYSDIAIGAALMFGYKLPENFNFPLLKPNIAQFWRNWHITLHDFIRDHFFVPVFAYRPSELKIYLGLMSTMVLLNVWHAFSWGFLCAGILNGFALVCWQYLQEMKRKHPRLSSIFNSKLGYAFSVLFTQVLCIFTALIAFEGVGNSVSLFSVIFQRM